MIINTEDFIVPNWFAKEHIESLINRKITDEEFADIKDLCDDILPDWVSEEVREVIFDNWEDIFIEEVDKEDEI